MNHSTEYSPLIPSDLTTEKMDKWMQAQATGEKVDVDLYGKPTEKQIRELENIRSLSRELQDNLHKTIPMNDSCGTPQELENSVRIADVVNQTMNPTAPILDFSEDHEFVAASADKYYSGEDKVQESEDKRVLTKGKPKSEIQQFYKDQIVFLTGGTGFLGKVLIEKLLRTCGDIDTIYVLIRNKKGKDARTRLHEMMDDFLFEKAHEMNPKGIHKVVPIIGDMELPGLGMSDEERRIVTSRTTVIINAAATVKFDEKLSISTAINVKGTKEVLKLAKDCRNLKAITHVSTAFANTQVKYVEEKFYEPPVSVEALEALSDLDEQLVENILPTLLGNRPNTYCFTKAVAEEAVRKYGEGLPICIVRPSIVVSTYEEPVRGWTDSVYGPTGLVIGIGTGVLRTMYLNLDIVADLVPVDLVVNAILASTWHTAMNYKENQTSDIPIYNFVSGAQNPIKWSTFIELNRKYGINIPTMKAVWYYGLTPTNSYYMFLILNFFLHYVPALFIDMYCLLTGKRRVMLKLYSKVMKLAHILFYFSTQDWKFSDRGVRNMWSSLSNDDKALFPFSLGEMSWDRLCETFLLGIRVYLIKDDISSLPDARRKWNRLFYMHQLVKTVAVALCLNLVYVILRPIFAAIFS